MPDYDAIVIGAGHNGLTAASVLAGKGLSVLVLEKTGWSGGMAATRELFPGYKHNVGAWALLIFRDEMMKRLGLDSYGLELIRPESSYCVFGDPGSKPFIGYTDRAELAQHLMETHGQKALEGLAGMAGNLQKFKELVDRQLFSSPRSIDELVAGEPDQKTRETLLKIYYGSAMDVLREFFPEPGEFDTILGSLCASSIDGTHAGPFSQGSGLSLAYHYVMGDDYDFRTPKGGIGSLSDAIESSCRDKGVKIEYSMAVEEIITDNNRCSGVKLKNGDSISADMVLSSLDARTTFLGLMDESGLPSDFVHRVKEIRYENGYIQVHMTLNELPEFTGDLAFANDNNIRWLMTYIPSAEHLSRCWDQYRKGEVPEEPVSYCAIPSLMDPTLAPGGGYTCTIFSHYYPYDVPKEKNRDLGNIMADRAIEQINRRAPNFAGSITNRTVLTHRYFQNTFGITGGDFCHGLIHPYQMWDKRPVPGWGGHRTPVENLFMCGSACHPGPGVTCLPGYNCANEVLANLGTVSSREKEEVS